jgi:hypothetical protein
MYPTITKNEFINTILKTSAAVIVLVATCYTIANG